MSAGRPRAGRRTPRRSLAALAVCAAVTGAALAGCGSDGGDDAAATPTARATP
ncbi:hypothetical protein SAMN05421806_12653, partial [Streptomyces indicus]